MDDRQQINYANLAGSRVLIRLHKPAFEALELQGVDRERFVGLVVGTDDLGIWVENPNYCTVPVYTDEGRYIPPEHRLEVCDRAVFLLRWEYILTILQFPDREHYQPQVEEREIGFRPRRPLGVTAEELVPLGSDVGPAKDSRAAKTPAGGKKAKERKGG